ncbi:hypothetical protein PDE_05955 [Penicillium oxalicum 114-2]|uniref:Rhodopsin domain-containing protein n=1 Tax=Penicillium oxalicum (strain 114-2 / CGMCC 5302) TaxID=933388 RepID=S7ZQR5_PENO1|nr:hypothetical protein PDE_05955 [Penicillium oxalicum 114-2]
MDDTGQPSQTPGGQIPESVFIGVLWALTGTAFVFVLFRLYVQLAYFHGLFIDDFLVILAWIIILTAAVIWQIYGRHLFQFNRVLSGQESLTLSALLQYHTFMHSLAPLQILFYTALWCIKFSFLSFFYRLSCRIKPLCLWWVIVVVITAGIYIASVADIEYKCSFGGLEYVMEQCPRLSHIHYENRSFWANCAGDVVTDMMILSIPISVLWNAQITRRRKIVLLSIFSATIFIMVVAVIRVGVKTSLDEQIDIAWLCFWSFVEVDAAILISCVASMRQLFISAQAKSTRERSTSNQNSLGRGVKSPPVVSSRVQPGRDGSDVLSSEGDVPLSPLSLVHVRHDFKLTRGAAKDRMRDEETGQQEMWNSTPTREPRQ